MGCSPWGRAEWDTTEATQQQQLCHSSPGAGAETIIKCKAWEVWVGWKGCGFFVEKVRASLNSL